MTLLALSLLLVAPSAIVRVPAEPVPTTCPANLEDARAAAISADAKVEQAVMAGDIIALGDLERITDRGQPTLPPQRRAFLKAADCVIDRVSKAKRKNLVDAEIALRAARMALAYRRPAEPVSRLEFVAAHWPRSVAADIARTLSAQTLMVDEGEHALGFHPR